MHFQRHSRRHAAVLLTGLFISTLFAIAVNTRVDPWRMIQAPWADPCLDPHRDISAVTRTGKAGLVRSRDDWQAAILGSSRVIRALNPQASDWGTMPVVNLGMPGAFLHENIAMAEYFIARQPAQILILGIDPGDLSSSSDTRPMSDFMSSPLHPGGALDRELRYVASLSTFEASIATLKLRAQGRPAEDNNHGFRVQADRGGASGSKQQLDFIRKRFIDDARLAQQSPSRASPNPEKIRKLGSLMQQCRQRGIRLLVFLHPNHVLLHARSEDTDQTNLPFEADRRLLTSLIETSNRISMPGPAIEFWDFYSYHGYNRERVRPEQDQAAPLPHWRDLEHFTRDIGDAILARMMGWQIDNPELRGYGTQIKAGNLEQHIATLRDDYQQYLREEAAGDLAWKNSLVIPNHP